MKKYSIMLLVAVVFGFIAFNSSVSSIAQSTRSVDTYPQFIQPQKTIVLRSLVSGQVKAINFEPQDYVQKGQPIIELDDELLRIRKKTIMASLELSTFIKKAEIRLAYSKDNLEIVKKLYGSKVGSSRVGSAKELKEATQAYELAIEDITEAKLEVRKLELALEELEKNLSFYSINAPVSGVIVPFNMVKQLEQENVKNTEVGEVVLERQALVALMKVDKLRVRSTARSEDYGDIKIGQKARVFIYQKNGGPKEIIGEVVFVSPGVGASLKVYSYEVEFDNPKVKTEKESDYPFVYRPNTRARVELITE
ncbi:MAG: HlyD family efflux transporter periplasmic adaptor subunit [Phycisphaerae bacterium]|nr:HlyD family efflux transporter periplasmic adaptor subunit [Phycisphaerae bacterium]